MARVFTGPLFPVVVGQIVIDFTLSVEQKFGMDATYILILQCKRQEVGVVAEYKANAPFPYYPEGSLLELPDCNPRTWNVISFVNRIGYDERGELNCITILIVDSPVLDD